MREIRRRRVGVIERKTEGIRQGEEKKFVNTCKDKYLF